MSDIIMLANRYNEEEEWWEIGFWIGFEGDEHLPEPDFTLNVDDTEGFIEHIQEQVDDVRRKQREETDGQEPVAEVAGV